MTEEELQKVCEEYGKVTSCQLKKKTVDGQTVSRRMAQVAYSTKEEAAAALKGLPFKMQLGDTVEVDLFQTKEGRSQEYELRNNPLR